MSAKRTPLIRPLRTKGGTFYTFSSAIEDIGLNVVKRNYDVALSHYALLNLQEINEKGTDDINGNLFNVYNMRGAVKAINADDGIFKDSKDYIKGENMIAQSFLSYALNMETAMLNDKRYNYAEKETVSERIFWKWLKEMGAIRWTKADDEFIKEGDKDNIENNKNYKNIVKAIGKIDSTSVRSDNYGVHNEVLINIPSSFGDMPIYFKTNECENYHYNMVISAPTNNDQNNNNDSLIGYSLDNGNRLDTSLYNIAFYDYPGDDVSSNYIVEGVDFINNNSTDTTSYFYYIDNKLNTSEDENYTITIKNKSALSEDDIEYKFLRSKYDCVTLDLGMDCSVYNDKSFDDFCKNGKDYDFNTILVYYTISDGNTKYTNLYGVYFINPPTNVYYAAVDDNNEIIENSSTTYAIKLPSINKIKSTESGFGTGYSFKLNMQSSSVYDNTFAKINDESGSESSLVTDFSEVVANLGQSVNLLKKHVRQSNIIVNKYDKISESLNNINFELSKINNTILDINTVIDSSKNVDCNNIEFTSMTPNDNKLKVYRKNIEEPVNFILDDSSVLSINDNELKIDKSILTNKICFNTVDGFGTTNDKDKVMSLINNLLNSLEVGIKNNSDLCLKVNDTNIDIMGYDEDHKQIDLITLLIALIYKLKN